MYLVSENNPNKSIGSKYVIPRWLAHELRFDRRKWSQQPRVLRNLAFRSTEDAIIPNAHEETESDKRTIKFGLEGQNENAVTGGDCKHGILSS